MDLTSWRKVAGQVFRDVPTSRGPASRYLMQGFALDKGKWTAVALVPSDRFANTITRQPTDRSLWLTTTTGSRPRSPAIPPLVSCMPVILFRHELLHTDEPSDKRIEDIIDTACLPLLHATTST
jgi:hypothetical protein